MQHLGEGVRDTASEWLMESLSRPSGIAALALVVVGGGGVIVLARRHRQRRRAEMLVWVRRQIDERYAPLDALRVRAEAEGVPAVLGDVRALLAGTAELALDSGEAARFDDAPDLTAFSPLQRALAMLQVRAERLREGKSPDPPPVGSNDLPGERLGGPR